MKAKGNVFKYGDNIDTDAIIAARYLSTADPDILKDYCMLDIDEEFASKVQAGDIMVAGKNFGCGSSREHAPIAIMGAGVSCVIAESFARIFYRNSFNIGLPIIESAEAAEKIQQGDQVEVNFHTGEIKNITRNEIYKGASYPEFIQKIINSDGLVNYVKASI